jgi:hypothetical protein
MKSEAGADEIYIPSWYGYQLLKFLASNEENEEYEDTVDLV